MLYVLMSTIVHRRVKGAAINFPGNLASKANASVINPARFHHKLLFPQVISSKNIYKTPF